MFKSGSVRSLVLFIVSLSPSIAFAVDNPAEVLLAQLVEHQAQYKYAASAVYIRPSGMEAVSVKRIGNLKHVSFGDDSLNQTLRTDAEEKSINGESKTLIVHQNKVQFHPLKHLHKNLQKGLKHYQLFVSENVDFVAGRAATRLSVISKTPDRYSYVYWVDAETYVILRRDVMDEDGELIERMVFTSFSLKEPMITFDEKGLSPKQYRYEENHKEKMATLNWLPSGFEIISVESINDSNNNLLDHRIIMTDGFASIMFYTGENNRIAKLTRGQQLDALHVYKTVVDGRHITIEGLFPYESLQQIGANISFKK